MQQNTILELHGGKHCPNSVYFYFLLTAFFLTFYRRSEIFQLRHVSEGRAARPCPLFWRQSRVARRLVPGTS
jgi:hypothetical protein